jgi:N-acetylglucosamine malate deacetylase 1
VTTILVIAPHPDDETLGCGGTLLKAIAGGSKVHWAIATTMTAEAGYSAERMAKREAEIQTVTQAYGFEAVYRAPFTAARLDTVPMADRVSWFSGIFNTCAPHTVYLPYPHDVHSDHAATFLAAAACTKSFRYPSVKRVLTYETISETEFGIQPNVPAFQPNSFVSIENQLERKLEIMALYQGELGQSPFPRSLETIRAQAAFRGSVAGCKAAEAFMLLREIE